MRNFICYIIAACSGRIAAYPDRRLGFGSGRGLLNFQCTDRKRCSDTGARIDIELTVRHRYRKRIRRIAARQKIKLRHAFCGNRRGTVITGRNRDFIYPAGQVNIEHMICRIRFEAHRICEYSRSACRHILNRGGICKAVSFCRIIAVRSGYADIAVCRTKTAKVKLH